MYTYLFEDTECEVAVLARDTNEAAILINKFFKNNDIDKTVINSDVVNVETKPQILWAKKTNK